jgi:D-arabinose 1-dehydrogenase-like Zn-dependent alcohol dehydrogenase
LKLNSPKNLNTVVRSEDKAKLAKEMGSDYVVNTKNEDIVTAVSKITGNQGVDAVLDIVSSTETLETGIVGLRKRGIMAIVGLMGRSFNLPIVQSVINEFSVIGSLWGNYNELNEVISLARANKIKTVVNPYRLGDVTKAIKNLESGKIHGRAILIS